MAVRRRHVGDDSGPTRSSGLISPTVAATFKKLDVYPKVQEEFTLNTSSGAAVSIISLVLIVILGLSELSTYLSTTRETHVLVDPTIGKKLQINVNITFHALHCGQVSLDAMDVAGDQQLTIQKTIIKERVSSTGDRIGKSFEQPAKAPEPLAPDYCGNCYGAGAFGECCNTCSDLKAAYMRRGWATDSLDQTAEQCLREAQFPHLQAEKGEGCRLVGSMLVNKVAGNFHVAVGESASRGAAHIHRFNPADLTTFNASHTVNSLSFGELFPGAHNPLDNVQHAVNGDFGSYYYYVKVIPTLYKSGSRVVETNQYTYNYQYMPLFIQGVQQHILPGAFFVYDFSAFMVEVDEEGEPFSHFLTGVCAIAGGVFTMAGLIHSCGYQLYQIYVRKMQRS